MRMVDIRQKYSMNYNCYKSSDTIMYHGVVNLFGKQERLPQGIAFNLSTEMSKNNVGRSVMDKKL